MYQLMVLINGELKDTSFPPRSLRSASTLARYYQRTWPQHSYWLKPVD